MSKKILIAEDEEPVAKVLGSKLVHSGFEVTVVANGNDAVDKLQTGNYDLAIIDLMMPGMDGFGVLEEMKKRNIQTKVVVASNLGQSEDEKKARDLGASDYFVKSNVPLSELVVKIQSLL